MQAEAFQILSEVIYKRSGIVLTPEKEYLLESRLQPFLKQWECADFMVLASKVKGFGSPALLKEMTEALTTNETSFFRDNKPFQYFADKLLPLLKEKQSLTKQLRFWSAACSYGQEAYSLVMQMNEKRLDAEGYNYQFLATDLAEKVLEKARDGLFSQFEVQRGMPIQLLLKYFTQTPDQNWQLKPEFRQRVNFKAFNLMDDPAAFGKFDVIFCRNVLIYFDNPTKTAVINRLIKQLQPHGYLVVGSTETVDALCPQLVPLPDNERGFYQLKS